MAWPASNPHSLCFSPAASNSCHFLFLPVFSDISGAFRYMLFAAVSGFEILLLLLVFSAALYTPVSHV
jgi:hypothetical protein